MSGWIWLGIGLSFGFVIGFVACAMLVTNRISDERDYYLKLLEETKEQFRREDTR